MKRIEGIDALAKEFGVPKSKLQDTFRKMTAIAKGEAKDPFGKKFFQCVSTGRARLTRAATTSSTRTTTSSTWL